MPACVISLLALYAVRSIISAITEIVQALWHALQMYTPFAIGMGIDKNHTTLLFVATSGAFSMCMQYTQCSVLSAGDVQYTDSTL